MGQWRLQAQRGLPTVAPERVRGATAFLVPVLDSNTACPWWVGCPAQLWCWCRLDFDNSSFSGVKVKKQTSSVGDWSLKQELIMNTKWKRLTVTFTYLSSFQWIPPSLTPTLLPSLSFGWIAVFEHSVSSCQLSSFAFEPYLSFFSWYLTKEFCCLWVLWRGLSSDRKGGRNTEKLFAQNLQEQRASPHLVLSLNVLPALTQIKIIFFCLSISSCSIYQLYITKNHYRQNPSTMH